MRNCFRFTNDDTFFFSHALLNKPISMIWMFCLYMAANLNRDIGWNSWIMQNLTYQSIGYNLILDTSSQKKLNQQITIWKSEFFHYEISVSHEKTRAQNNHYALDCFCLVTFHPLMWLSDRIHHIKMMNLCTVRFLHLMAISFEQSWALRKTKECKRKKTQ